MQAVTFPLEVNDVPSPPLADEAPQEAPETTSAPPIPLPQEPSPGQATWTSALLSVDPVFSARREALRFVAGLGLAAVYGLALGARDGRFSFLSHAVGVPAALLVAFGVGIPALFIVLALLDAPVVPSAVAAAAARATASAGLVLAGLAPAAALFVVTSEQRGAAALAAGAGLAIGGAFGLGNVVSDLYRSLEASRWTIRILSNVVFGVFGLFAVVVTLRVWGSLLPLLGGGQ